MLELKKRIRLHSIKMSLIWFFLAIFTMILMLLGSINIKSLTSYCEVSSESDLNKCWKENPYVEIHTKAVVDAGYDYLYNKKKVARFSLVEVNGYAMVSLIEPQKLEQLKDDTSENIVIRGKLEKFEKDAKLKGYNAIKDIMVKNYQGELTREEILNLFTLVQLNQYNGSKMSLYFFALLGSFFICLFIFFGIKEIMLMKNPSKYHFSDQIMLADTKEVERIANELESKNYDFQYKNIYLTKHYLIVGTPVPKLARRENVAWIYEKVVKQKGITTNRNWVVHSLDRKNPLVLSSPFKKHQELGEQLRISFPNATFGYSTELSKKWIKEPNSFIEKKKNR